MLVVLIIVVQQKPLSAERALELAQWKFARVATKHDISTDDYYPLKFASESELGFDFYVQPRVPKYRPIYVSVMKRDHKIRVYRSQDKASSNGISG
jgi:hypothetical protein